MTITNDTPTPCTCTCIRRTVAAALRDANTPCPVHAAAAPVETAQPSALNGDGLQAALIAKLNIATTTQEN